MQSLIPLIKFVLPPWSAKDKIESIRNFYNLFTSYNGLRFLAILIAAKKAGFLDVLAEGEGLTCEEICLRAGTQREKTELVLDAITHFGILRKSNGLYKLTDLGRRVVSDKRGSLKYLIDFIDLQWKPLNDIHKILKDGKPAKELDIFRKESVKGRISLLYAVNSFLYTPTKELLEKYDFSPVKRVILGSMGVSFAYNITKKYKDAKITFNCYTSLLRKLSDLLRLYPVPDVNIEDIHGVLASGPHKGDPFKYKWGNESKPYDLVFLTKKLVLKPYSEYGEKFLKKSYRVLSDGGYVVIWETIFDDSMVSPRFAVLESILDVLVCYPGKRWSFNEIKRNLYNIGFSKVTKINCSMGAVTFIIAKK